MNTAMEVKVKAWSPSVMCKSPDNIVSSPFTSQKVFIPSYEKEKRPCIEQLLTNEYQRIWWQEKESWDKRYQGKTATKKLLHRMVKGWHADVRSFFIELYNYVKMHFIFYQR
ncbi:hypothetical protein WH47_06667 [Habropoda laboriosa]|uniref:Uncharacterized protein n=1 Tax=Habropoda laboriosa TaxID=597456 RepID=A0A0L7QRZ6_9HYME|nr:hypothetical protein WH47_06667 [Habropoda laboriosa]